MLHDLFRKWCTKFHHNRPSFVGDITENISASYFSGHSVYKLFISTVLRYDHV